MGLTFPPRREEPRWWCGHWLSDVSSRVCVSVFCLREQYIQSAFALDNKNLLFNLIYSFSIMAAWHVLRAALSKLHHIKPDPEAVVCFE